MDEALDLYDARDETLEFDGLERALLLCAAMNRKRDGERVPRSEDNQGDRARRETAPTTTPQRMGAAFSLCRKCCCMGADGDRADGFGIKYRPSTKSRIPSSRAGRTRGHPKGSRNPGEDAPPGVRNPPAVRRGLAR